MFSHCCRWQCRGQQTWLSCVIVLCEPNSALIFRRPNLKVIVILVVVVAAAASSSSGAVGEGKKINPVTANLHSSGASDDAFQGTQEMSPNSFSEHFFLSEKQIHTRRTQEKETTSRRTSKLLRASKLCTTLVRSRQSMQFVRATPR